MYRNCLTGFFLILLSSSLFVACEGSLPASTPTSLPATATLTPEPLIVQEPTFTPTSTPTATLTPTSTPDPIVFQKGFALPSWWFDHYCTTEAGIVAIRDIAELGADWIQLVPTWYQENKNANEVVADISKTSDDECLVRAIEAAHNNGMGVMLKPHIDSLDGYDRGQIAPANPEIWFAHYNDMILHYADIAHENNVELFVVGTELKSVSGRAFNLHWRTLITEVRQRYFNRLVYAANWDEFDLIEFWDALDYIGIDAYFPLSSSADPSLEALLTGWQNFTYQQREHRWADEVASFASAVNKPVIFTEIGYASQDGAAIQPWSQENSQRPNEQLQTRLYEAALRTFWDQQYFWGVYWWLWDLQPDPRFVETGFMPKEAALQQVQQWYQFTPPEMPPEPTPIVNAPLTETVPAPITATPTLISPPPATQPPLSSLFTYGWDDCSTGGWFAQTYEESQGITSVAGSGDVAKTGSCSLRLTAHLIAQDDNFSKGETLRELAGSIAFSGQTITCWVYAPADALGPAESPNGVQLFVKDSVFRSEYGSWFDLEEGWNLVELTPSNSTPPDGGFKDPDFDPNDVLWLGVKIGTGGLAPSSYTYDGPFYVDDCTG